LKQSAKNTRVFRKIVKKRDIFTKFRYIDFT